MNDRDRPSNTSGPSLPISGPQPSQPFNAGVAPGRDAPGAGTPSATNPFAQVHRSAFGGGQEQDPRASFSPAITLPTGGGAVRSIGETFSPNPFTGTGSFAVPVATSPGRGGFGPSLSLAYGSGQGNGPWGLGWMLGVPAIARKTDRGLPRYLDHARDVAERDTFVLAGVDDLVAELDAEGKVASQLRDGYRVHRFFPRVEGGFARVERWTSQSTGEVHWRTLSPGNVTSYFGKTASARVTDPLDPKRVFSWLLEESHDDRGNIIVYEYKREDLDGVRTRAPEEYPRLEKTTVQAQRYLKRIKYGNATPFQWGGWLFEVVLDYGEHGTWHGDQLEVSPAEDRPWPVRPDSFSSVRPGFELRTRRLCRRVLMFHHFEQELGQASYLVASTDLIHEENPSLTRIVGVVQRSYRLDEQSGWYDAGKLPTLELAYSEAVIDQRLHEIDDPTTLQNLPAGIDGRMSRLVDLDGEGLPGILVEQGNAWYYKPGVGDGRFGPMCALPSQPSTIGAGGFQLMDLDGDGSKEFVSFVAPTPGFFRRISQAGWEPFRAFGSVPNIDWDDPRVQMIDLSGDGFPDILIDRGNEFCWYRSKGTAGFDGPFTALKRSRDEHSRPVMLFADAQVSVQFADMTGDGLADLVRVGNGVCCYWPNIGFGKFGPMIRMRGLRPFDGVDSFHPKRLRLADVDGSGTTDLIYLGRRGALLCRNLSGNGFGEAEVIERFPGVVDSDWAEVVDLKGNGTGCLVWSSSNSAGRGGVLRYIDLMGGQKPHLLVATKNNMGAETRVRYAPSTKFYLADKQAGTPWATKLPFPVQVVERVESIDHVTRQRYVQHFAYHHGYFDGHEREFRGFGMVESWDTEAFADFAAHDGLFSFEQFDAVEENLHQPPVYTKSWFHTGAFIEHGKLSKLFAEEYWGGDEKAFVLPDSRLPLELFGAETREAVRALAGKTLRSEVYALDGSALEGVPYSVSEATFEVRQVQARGINEFGVYLPLDREGLSYHYERNAADPRVAHSFVLEVDDYGTPLRSAAVAYPRRVLGYAEQGRLHVTLSEAEVVHLDDQDDVLRLGVPVEARSYELHGLTSLGGEAFRWQDLRDAADTATAVAYDGPLTGGVDKRLLSRSRSRYMADDLSGPLAFGSVESKALAYDSEAMAMTETQRQAVFGTLTGAPTDAELEAVGGYVSADDAWWVRSGHATYDASKFYAVTSVEDPYNNIYSTTYDAHTLLTVSSADPFGNTVTAAHDYRLLAPWQLIDPNGNRSQVAFDVLGFVSKTAVMGKVGDSDGDTLSDPTSTFDYDLFAWQSTGKPNWARSRVRETHQDVDTRWLEQRTYFSGAGGVVMVKAQARPGLAPERDPSGELVLIDGELQHADTSPALRWVGNGRVVLDNKGNVLKAYEPYYSSTPAYEDEAELVEQGVSPLNHYDPLGRLVRTDLPNGTFSRVEFTPWEQTTWDPNDNVQASDWHAARIGYAGDDIARLAERRAAQLAETHDNTPAKVHLDTLGRPFLSIADNGDNQHYATRSVLDIQGNLLQVIDARDNIAETRTYGMLGQPLVVASADAGDRTGLLTALGEPMHDWDSRGQRFSFTYDILRRPINRTVSVAGGAETLLSRIVYGEQLSSPADTNHIGRVYRVYDGAGVATSQAFDFEGHPVSEQRQLVSLKTTQPDWSALLGQSTIADMATAATSLLDAETFSASSQHDALGRVLTAVSPDGSEVHYGYDEGGGLQEVELGHRGSQTLETVVGDIRYDAKGRREHVVHGSTASPTTTTRYTYDPLSQRLTRLRTVRQSDGAALQSLHYHYDPVGNITDIRDTAQQTVYFKNTVVEAANSYEYDALYRLVEAKGREHATQGTTQRTHEQLPVGAQPMTSDPSAMRRYTQRYTYDSVGNILTMQHIPADGTEGWTRRYAYAEDGNRLLATSAPGDAAEGPYTHTYSYDAHGSMSTMPHLPSMVWNHDDELQAVTAGTETVYFQYAGGSRSRKYTEKNGDTTEERIYLGPFEIYRKRVDDTLKLERESLHVSDGSGRICIVETKTVEGGPVEPPAGIWRYQLGNHLGSAATEVDGSGAIISYEEYHPYGTSAYRATNSSIQVSAKRYRYTGMERDEETGLAYHSARYYANWLGRWSAADPSGLLGGINVYEFGKSSPTANVDLDGRAPRGCTGGGFSTANPNAPWGCANDTFIEFEDDEQVGPGLDFMAKAVETKKRHDVSKKKAEGAKERKQAARQQLAQESPELYSIMFVKDMITVEQAAKVTATLFVAGAVSGGLGFGAVAAFEAANATGIGAMMIEGVVTGAVSGFGAGATEGFMRAQFEGQDTFNSLNEAAEGGTMGALVGGAIGLGVAGFSSLRMVAGRSPRLAPAAPEGRAIPSSAKSQGVWESRLPGIQVTRRGDWWLKRVNPNAGPIMRRWGKASINAQHRSLTRLGDMATPHKRIDSVLHTKDVGPVMDDGFRLLNAQARRAYIHGSRRLGNPINDIQPRNMGKNGLIFDPAIDPVTLSVGVGAGIAIAGGVVGAYALLR